MLGHNHVIVNRTLGGWVRYAGTVPEASFALTVPDVGFVIDDDGARREEGADFASVYSHPDDDAFGTIPEGDFARQVDRDFVYGLEIRF